MEYSEAITKACMEMNNLLIEKNKAYGNSIFDPVHIFATGNVLDQINVRIDDKLSRLLRGNEYPGDDTLRDLAGYYLIKRAYEIALDMSKTSKGMK